MNTETIKRQVKTYYDDKLQAHGPTATGVDWNSAESQSLRFQQLLRAFDLSGPSTVSLNDYGCGYGALCGYLQEQGLRVSYHGYDLSNAMIEEARRHYPENDHIHFHAGDALQPAAYTVASGILNVKQDLDTLNWQAYTLECLHKMNEASLKGFAFNVLTAYNDPEYRREYLFYADPCFYLDYVIRHFSRHVALYQDYGLYEFTLAVKKVL